jgi:hypothetical protein
MLESHYAILDTARHIEQYANEVVSSFRFLVSSFKFYCNCDRCLFQVSSFKFLVSSFKF